MPFLVFFFFYVLQLETSISGLLVFVGREKETLWFPLIVFGSMTLGSGLALWIDANEKLLKSAFHVLALPMVLLFATLRLFPEAHLIPVVLVFLSIGAVMTALYAQVELWNLVVSFFIGGIAFYTALFFGANEIAQYQNPILATTLFLMGLAQASSMKERGLVVALALVVGVLSHFDYFRYPSRLQQVLPTFKGVRQLAQPRYSGLFRTDLLYIHEKDILLLQANGARFAILPSKRKVDSALRGKSDFGPTHGSPYMVSQPKKVLVIGPAEGDNVIAALGNSVKEIWTVDINPNMYNFSLEEARGYTGGFYDRPEVHRIVGEGRHFLETTDQKFDLITLQGVQTGSNASLEAAAQIESYLFTEEALKKLWERLTENGMIYLDEYQYFYSEQSSQMSSLLQSLAKSAKDNLDIKSPEQVRMISYEQPSRNPNSNGSFRRRREALFISKTPIADETFNGLLNRVGRSVRAESGANAGKAITDDRPLFVVANIAENRWAVFLTCVFVFAGVGLWSFRRKEVRQSSELLLIGIVYMLFVMAISGPATLILGHPGYVAPIVYGGLLGGSLFGAWFVLKFKGSAKYGEIALLIFLLAYGLLHTQIKDQLIGVSSQGLRFATILILGFVFGFLVEIPYIHRLAQVNGWNRGFRFFVENAGTVVAVPLGLLVQAQWGLSASLGLSVVLAMALAILVLTPVLKGKRS